MFMKLDNTSKATSGSLKPTNKLKFNFPYKVLDYAQIFVSQPFAKPFFIM